MKTVRRAHYHLGWLNAHPGEPILAEPGSAELLSWVETQEALRVFRKAGFGAGWSSCEGQTQTACLQTIQSIHMRLRVDDEEEVS